MTQSKRKFAPAIPYLPIMTPFWPFVWWPVLRTTIAGRAHGTALSVDKRRWRLPDITDGDCGRPDMDNTGTKYHLQDALDSRQTRLGLTLSETCVLTGNYALIN
jgi:hypothetical protein